MNERIKAWLERPLGAAVMQIVVVTAIGIAVILVTLSVKHLAEQARDTGIANACNSAASRKFPHLLSDDAELAKAIAWGERCRELNGVHAPPIRTPDQ